MIEHDATAVSWQTNRHSRFEVAAPRHFLLPAILLAVGRGATARLRPGEGCPRTAARSRRSAECLSGPRPTRIRRLIGSSPEEPRAGQSRRVYSLTAQGEQALRLWMGVIKQERDGLDRVLRRYVATGTVDAVLAEVEGGWHAVTATPWSPVSSTSTHRARSWIGTFRRAKRDAEIDDDDGRRRSRTRRDEPLPGRAGSFGSDDRRSFVRRPHHVRGDRRHGSHRGRRSPAAGCVPIRIRRHTSRSRSTNSAQATASTMPNCCAESTPVATRW